MFDQPHNLNWLKRRVAVKHSHPQGWSAPPNGVACLLHGRGVRLLGKWRDVAAQIPGLSVDAPDVAASAPVIVSSSAVARGRQKPDQIAAAFWTFRGSRHRKALEPSPPLFKGSALVLRAHTTAPVFDDGEIRARATTQVHKVAREGYRVDVGGAAFWAGCNRATTLVAGAGARHIGTPPFAARNVPANKQTIRAKLRAVGAGCQAEVLGSDPFRQPWGNRVAPGDSGTCGSSRRGSGYRATERATTGGSATAPGAPPALATAP